MCRSFQCQIAGNHLLLKTATNNLVLMRLLDDCGFDIVAQQLRNGVLLGTHIALKSDEVAKRILRMTDDWVEVDHTQGYTKIWSPQDVSSVTATLREILPESIDIVH